MKAGYAKARSAVHRDGDWHRAVHVWILCLETGQLVLQRRAAAKDAWAGLLDISTAGNLLWAICEHAHCCCQSGFTDSES
jgi:isopentenyldiphosphate isomerase